jgi:hypothetical protein
LADETVRQRLEFDASQAIQALKSVDEAAQTVAGKAALLNKNLQDYSRALGQNWKTTLAQMKELAGGEFAGFSVADQQGQSVDVTSQVFKQTEELARNAQAKNQFATADSNAAKAEMNFDGTVKQTNASIGEQSKKLQVLAAELNRLKSPPQGRDAQGRFASAAPPSFQTQFAAATSYQQQLKLVETTISNLQKKTNLPFKDIGKELGKSFPQLLKDTNLVSVAVDNLSKQNAGLSASFKTQAEMISRVSQELTRHAATGRLNLTGTRQQQVDQLKGVIKETSKITGAQYGDVANQLEKMGIKSAQTQAAVRGLNKELTHGVKEANTFGHGIDLVRTALGTLTAVGIFQVISFIQEAFQTASKNAQELEASLYRLANAERILSQEGVEISYKGLEEGIKRIKKLTPIFSKEDITGLVGQLVISTKELGLNEQQIIDLAESIAVLNINSAANESLMQTTSHVVSSLLTSNAKGVSSLGIQLGNAAIEAKAFDMNILEAGESFSDLTAQEKNMVKVQIAIDAGRDSIAGLNDFMQTNTARVQQNKAAWNDLLTTVGQLFLPLIPLATKFFSLLNDGFNMVKTGAVVFLTLGTVALTTLRMIASGGIKSFGELKTALHDLGAEAKSMFGNLFFPEGVPDNAPGWFKEFFGGGLERPETPTNPYAESAGEVEGDGDQLVAAVADTEEKITDIMEDARQKRQDIDEQYRRKIEDANRDHAQKMQDIARDVERKQEDALRNYNQKVEDINRNAAESVAEAQADYREREVEREQDYQRRLQELRERFLMNLEDALRERDARQVLRLIREYNLEKKQLAEKRKSEGKDAERDLARKLADIERERLLKLEAARRELAEKQAEIALWAERERQDAAIALQRKLADARRWHQLELQEYQQYLRRKLEELARSIVREYQLTAAGAQAIYQLLNGYFGAGGAVAGLMNGLSASLNGVLSSSSSGGSVGTNTNPGFAGSGMYGTYAEGGTYVATRPTKAIFGERGPEMATFTPINRTGQDVNKLFGDISPGGGGGNSIDLRVSLSRDLIAEVVDATLENVAIHLDRLNRER